jgi:magnesium transporter
MHHGGKSKHPSTTNAVKNRTGDVLYICQLVGRPVMGADGKHLGSVRDLVVGVEEPEYPPARGLVAHSGGRQIFVSAAEIALLDLEGARLSVDRLPEAEFQRRDGEILLSHDLLDQQIIALTDLRVVRVNDAAVRQVDGRWRLVGVDVGLVGLLRRFGPRWITGRLVGDLVDWATIEPLAAEMAAVRLRVPHGKLATLHPADIARVIDQLPPQHGAELIAALADGMAADTLEEI